MALRVSTVSSTVYINDLGLVLEHPTVDRDLSLEFTSIEIKNSSDLTFAIQNGDLIVDDGNYLIAASDYDSDNLLLQELDITRDASHVSHAELSSIGSTHIIEGEFPLEINSTASITKNIYVPSAQFITWQLDIGDKVSIYENIASGIYTVDSIVDQQNFIVVEPIVSTTSGMIEIYHPVGASLVGIEDTNFDIIAGTDLQTVIDDIDDHLNLRLTISGHRYLDELVHDIAESSYEEYTYTDGKITALTVWTNTDKTIKIREEQYSYTGSNIDEIIIIQYDATGIEIERITEIITRQGSQILSIDRELTL